jgi:pyrroline-5-carboxylate reductase
MAAGVTLEKLLGYFGEDKKIIRIMPNTPVKVGEGVIAWCPSDRVTKEDEENFLSVSSPCGFVDKLPESLIDAECAVAGCGPAFVYMFIEALADGGVMSGLPRDKAMLYAAETLIGAAEMVKQTGRHPGALKDAVCSPGGSTIEGVKALEDGKLRGTVSGAVVASYEKTLKLGK